MGLFIWGDFDHMSWLKTQSMDDISEFGGCLWEPKTIRWRWSVEDDMNDVIRGLKEADSACKKTTGKDAKAWLDLIRAREHNRSGSGGIEIPEVAMRYAARYELGLKIKSALEDYHSIEIEIEESSV